MKGAAMKKTKEVTKKKSKEMTRTEICAYLSNKVGVKKKDVQLG